jgi:hypothetical protein
MRIARYLATAALVGLLGGCADVLDVPNENNPDRPRVLASPADVESLGGAQFQQIIRGTVGALDVTQSRMMSWGLEQANALANNAMGPGSAIPRQPVDNSRGNPYQEDNFATYRFLSFVARNASDVTVRARNPSFTLASTGDVTRLRAWSHFISGVAHGYLSLVYDSATIAQPSDSTFDMARGVLPPFSGYADVNAYAMAQFDSALAYLNVAGMTAVPATWLQGPDATGSIAVADFRRIVRSFRARLRAGVARNPTERAAVDWQAVIADATNGITSDLIIHMRPGSGWDFHWLHSSYHYRDANWHQAQNYIIGMADVSGAYDVWLSQPREARVYFTIVTPDLRFPQGATRAAQNRTPAADDTPLPRRPLPGDTTKSLYFRNRQPSKDPATTGWHISQYDHYRFRAYASAARIGPIPWFTKAENDMLAAEGYIRTGNIAAAAALIDITRAEAGLPLLTGSVTTIDQPVPGGGNCVPQVPVGPTFTSTACGNILEAMKWEKRMETAFTTFAPWYFDGRGWGDLPEGTPVHYPVPVQERDARGLPYYNLGGVGREGGSGPSTYGFGTGTR